MKEFPKDFILKLEFRAEVNADSGIFLRKPQLQCRDYLVAGPYKELKKYKAQDWNVIEVVVKDGKARCTCNGEVLAEALQLPPPAPSAWKPTVARWSIGGFRLKSCLEAGREGLRAGLGLGAGRRPPASCS